MYGYAGLLALATLSDLAMWNRLKKFRWLLVYEMFSGLFLAVSTVIYFTPAWTAAVAGWYLTPLVAAVLAADLWLTVRSTLPQRMVRELTGDESPDSGIYNAEMLALIIGAPGYLCAVLLAAEYYV